jgi:hypothetical protein
VSERLALPTPYVRPRIPWPSRLLQKEWIMHASFTITPGQPKGIVLFKRFSDLVEYNNRRRDDR